MAAAGKKLTASNTYSTVFPGGNDPLRITCPADITVTVPPDQSSVAVSFDGIDPTIMGGTPPYNITYNPESGTTFDIGETDVRCTVTDKVPTNGDPVLSRSCSFKVIAMAAGK